MNKAQRREVLREQLRPVLAGFFGDALRDVVLDALIESVTDAVYPLVRDAYGNGRNAADSRAGYRLTQENERLRRELELTKKGLA